MHDWESDPVLREHEPHSVPPDDYDSLEKDSLEKEKVTVYKLGQSSRMIS